MGEVLRGAVIGAGGVVARLRHIPALQEAERRGTAKIVAVCEPVPAALDLAGEQAGVGTNARYVDWRDLLARDDIDVITIATPNSLHEPIAIAALGLLSSAESLGILACTWSTNSESSIVPLLLASPFLSASSNAHVNTPWPL